MDKTTQEQIERMFYKGNDDIAISVARSLERFEEKLDSIETRLYSRIAELEDIIKESNK